MKDREFLLSEAGIREKFGKRSYDRNKQTTEFLADRLGPQASAELQKAFTQAETDRQLAKHLQDMITKRAAGEDISGEIGLLNRSMPEMFRTGKYGDKTHGGVYYEGQSKTELERLLDFVLSRISGTYSQAGGILSGKRDKFEFGFDETGAFQENLTRSGGGRFQPTKDRDIVLGNITDEGLRNMLALDPSKLDKFSEEFILSLITGVEQAKIDQMSDAASIRNLDTERRGVSNLITSVDARIAALETVGPSGTGMEGGGAGAPAEVHKGILLPNGAINPEFLNTFNGTFEELLEAYREAKVKAEDENETGMDKFSKNLNQFSGVIGMMGALTGEEEKTAKIMAKVAKIQLMITMYERAKMALETEGGIFAKLGAFLFSDTGGRQGGIMSKHGRSYSKGGIADGPNSGYTAMLHGREAVVPLPNGRAIPVEMTGGGMNTNNTNITINIEEGGATTSMDSDGGKELGVAIQGVVQAELEKQMRPGGILGA